VKNVITAAIIATVSFNVMARGHRGGHHSYHAYHAPARHSITHHVARTAAGTATRNMVNRVTKPKRTATQPRYNNAVQPMPPVPATVRICNDWAGMDNNKFITCQKANGR